MAEDPVVVALMSDDRFAPGAAVTGRSLLDHRPAGSSTTIVVLDGGLAPTTRDRLVASWDGATEVTSRPVAAAPSPKLGLGALLAGHDRALYLDTDTLVQADVAPLLVPGPPGTVVRAVQDTMVPYVRDDVVPAGFESTRDTPYFNAGVLGIDLEAWRAEGIGGRALSAHQGQPPGHWSRARYRLRGARR